MSESQKIATIAHMSHPPRSESSTGEPRQGEGAAGARGNEAAGGYDPEVAKILSPLERHRAEDPKALAEAVERLEDLSRRIGRDLEFQVDEDTGRTVVTVYVSGTDELVRRIPPEEMLELAERMEELRGLLFNGQA